MSTSFLPVMSQIALPKARAFLVHSTIFGRVDLRQLPPALEVLAVDDALGAEREHVVALALVRDDADGVGARGGAELHGEHAEPAGGAPHQHIVARLQLVRRVAEQHAIGGRERQRVAGRFFPGEVLRALHQLAVLDAAELGEGAVRRLIAPDALRGREHRVAAVALLVVPVVLVAVDDHLVADLPALHLGADRPDDAGSVGAGDVIGIFVRIEHGDGLAERGPDAIVIDARPPSRAPARRGCRAPRSARPRAAWRFPAAHAAPCGSPRRTCSWEHARAAESRPSHRGLSYRSISGSSPYRPYRALALAGAYKRGGAARIVPKLRAAWPFPAPRRSSRIAG